jgi:hypothetical protein
LNLAAFLENAGVEKLGESMVRFVGTEGELELARIGSSAQ